MTSYHCFACAECFVLWLYKASMVGHKYGVLRWSKTGSTFSISLPSVLCKLIFSALTRVSLLFQRKQSKALLLASLLFLLLALFYSHFQQQLVTFSLWSLSLCCIYLYITCSLLFHAFMAVCTCGACFCSTGFP